ncbi:MAG: alanine--tRNA ligase, partial [Nanoarchaeota archaeon]
MNRAQLIKAYINFFKKKGHAEIPNASLIPAHDPTVLFTTAGMHPLVPYLLGQKHPLGKRLVNVQRCIRTQDIDEVGDATHHTFFEMLGNWSLGDYWKKEAIEFSYEFLTKILKLEKDRLAVSCFGGDTRVASLPIDQEAADLWLAVGMPKERIAFLEGGVFESKKNWWGPAGKTGPCGPDTEMFFWKLKKKKAPLRFDPDDENWVEIWNDVLMQYEKNEKDGYVPARQKNIDTGMGVERTLAVLAHLEDNYLTDAFLPIIKKIETLSKKKYGLNKDVTTSMRIIADHIKASVFIIADGVLPANSEQGYVLRRLIRRAVRYGRNLGLHNFIKKIAESVFDIYKDYEILKYTKKILAELEKEEQKFLETLEKGIGVFDKIMIDTKKISGHDAFLLYQSYGFPLEMTQELAREKNISVDEQGFYAAEKKHQELSRTAAE